MIDPLSGEDVPGDHLLPDDPFRDDPLTARLPPLSPAALDDAQRVAYEAVTGRPDGDGPGPSAASTMKDGCWGRTTRCSTAPGSACRCRNCHCSTLVLHLRVFRVGVPAGEPAPRWPAADSD